jgi:hypothetical protein
MPWRKRGLIFVPDGRTEWMSSHAQVPTVLVQEDRLCVFFAARDSRGQARTGLVELDRNDPSRILYRHSEPVLDLGRPGTFDDDGTMPSHALVVGQEIWLYYSGWNQRVRVPYHNAMGLAVSRDGGRSFTRMFEGPILDRTAVEPYVAVTPSVMREGSRWHMWYVSGTKWVDIDGRYEPVYVVKYCHSQDGVNWVRPNITCIAPAHELEAFSRPHVIKQGALYRMWFCCRGSQDYREGRNSYRIGYAESPDGVSWDRQGEPTGLTVSGDGWDSAMMCYPYPFVVDDTLYLLHNGNGFGRSGFGFAVWENL